MRGKITIAGLMFGALFFLTACAAPQSISTIPSEPPAQPSAAVAEPVVSSEPTPPPTPTQEPTPSPAPTPEPISILGSWILVGTYDPEKWGWDVDKTKPLPEEKIDKVGEEYTIALKEDTLEDGNSGEAYQVSYDELGLTADVKDNIYWQFCLVDGNQLFEFYGDTLSIYQRVE